MAELRSIAAAWDAEAPTFDEAADHGLRDPEVRAAWRDLLIPLLPGVPGRVADLGCGTGSLSLMAADAGHQVIGVDLSTAMLHEARAKAAGRADVWFVRGDASRPPLRDGGFDALLCRHVLWALPDPVVALQRWVDALRVGGRLLLVEGRWWTGAGVTLDDCLTVVRAVRAESRVVRLTDERLWGAPTDDERYLVVSDR